MKEIAMRKIAKKPKKLPTLNVCGVEIYAPKEWRAQYKKAMIRS
jgi:hypothetical protein